MNNITPRVRVSGNRVFIVGAPFSLSFDEAATLGACLSRAAAKAREKAENAARVEQERGK